MLGLLESLSDILVLQSGEMDLVGVKGGVPTIQQDLPRHRPATKPTVKESEAPGAYCRVGHTRALDRSINA